MFKQKIIWNVLNRRHSNYYNMPILYTTVNCSVSDSSVLIVALLNGLWILIILKSTAITQNRDKQPGQGKKPLQRVISSACNSWGQD